MTKRFGKYRSRVKKRGGGVAVAGGVQVAGSVSKKKGGGFVKDTIDTTGKFVKEHVSDKTM